MSDDSIDHLDWELDEGWVPMIGPETTTSGLDYDSAHCGEGWGMVTHFQVVPTVRVTLDDCDEYAAQMPAHEFPILWVMVAVAIPFWAIFLYGLYRLVFR